jgi:hypothetical protein
VENSIREAVSYKGDTYDVVLIPVKFLGKSFVKGPVFSNL